MGAVINGISPDVIDPVGTGTVTLNNGTLYLSRVKASNDLIVNGGTLYQQNGWGATWSGPITLNATLPCDTYHTLNISGDISGTGGLTKSLNGPLNLSGTNSYTGPTSVTAGTLQCDNPDALGGGDLSISTGTAKLNLNYTGTKAVASLTLDGVPQPGGTHGSSSSGADFPNDTYFVGTGTVAVPLSSEKNMLIFSFGALGAATIGDTTITLEVPYGTDRTNLAPTYTVPGGATGSPPSGTALNFTGPQTYTVTAQDLSTKEYTVTVTVAPILIWDTPSGSGDWDFTTSNWIDSESGTSQLFADGLFVMFNNPSGGAINIPAAVLPLATTVSDGDYTFSGGPIAGTGSLTMDGAGTLTLAGANTYSGDTAVNAGTLEAIGNSAVGGSTSFTVADGATLLLSGTSGGYKWPAAAATLTGAGTVSIPLGGSGNIGLNFDMSEFTGVLDITSGMMAVNPYYSPSFVSPANGTIRVENNTTLYLGWTGFTLNTTVEIMGGSDNGEGYGVLRGDNATINGAVILGTNSTIGCAGGTFTINAVISDGGNGFGFTQVKNGTVVLAAANTYSGPTVVSGGATLQCNNPDGLGNGGPLSISSGKVNLNYTGTKTVASLTLGGLPQTAPGTYGSVASGADFPNDTYFAGTGTVTVASSSDYDAWAALFDPADLTDPDADLDGDGLSNDRERVFGLDPTDPSSVNPISFPLDPATGTFSFTRREQALTGLSYSVWTSTDLQAWTKDAGAVLTPGAPAAEVETVAVTLSPALLTGPKLFVQVRAAVLFSADFESDNGGFSPTGTPNDWAWGAPNSDNDAGLILTTGNGGSAKCWATVLGTGGTAPFGVITPSADSILQGPDASGTGIDLNGVTAANLEFAAAVDAVAGDTIEILVKQVGTGNTLVTVPATALTPAVTAGWTSYGPYDISAAVGNNVYLEFRYVGINAIYIGLYIDDVVVTETTP